MHQKILHVEMPAVQSIAFLALARELDLSNVAWRAFLLFLALLSKPSDKRVRKSSVSRSGKKAPTTRRDINVAYSSSANTSSAAVYPRTFRSLKPSGRKTIRSSIDCMQPQPPPQPQATNRRRRNHRPQDGVRDPVISERIQCTR